MDRIGRYKIVRELGRGAMGIVYHAIDPNIGRPVAIKTIQLGGKPEESERLRERLFREARSAGILSHPGIVTIYDVEQQGSLAYIAMEFVDGPTLDHVMAPGRALTPDKMFSVLAQAAAALDYAHLKGIVHRDIKPANIMIAADGTAKIADFGIAKITASDQFTVTGAIVGTPHYMSPEQVQGQAVDGRSDQFSLAVIAFEMLTGDKPHTGEQLTTVVYKIVAEEPISPRRLNATLSPAIENVLRKGLAKKPDARYRTCTELVGALEKACAASPGWKAMPRGGAAEEPTASVVSVAAKPAMKLPPARHPVREDETTATSDGARKRSGFWPFLAAILVAAVVLGLLGWQADPDLPQKVGGFAQRIQAALGMGTAQAPAAEQQPPAGAPAQAPAAAQGGAPTAPAAQPQAASGDDAKPSPIGSAVPNGATQPAPQQQAQAQPPADAAAPASAPAQTPASAPAETPATQAKAAVERARPAAPEPVAISSSPAGAIAILDARRETACTTPCSLTAAPGHHVISVTMAGYQLEHIDVDVGSAPLELPPVVMRAMAGTLMVTSAPEGAAVSVNGKRVNGATPTQIPLQAGTYRVTVEKDGKQAVSNVDIKNGAISYLKVTLP
ncbi:MAG TPA: protein kinase [Bryobacteraceae bacterium]|nr:protein kinase [Bryobacteraceae bacterium]